MQQNPCRLSCRWIDGILLSTLDTIFYNLNKLKLQKINDFNVEFGTNNETNTVVIEDKRQVWQERRENKYSLQYILTQKNKLLFLSHNYHS